MLRPTELLLLFIESLLLYVDSLLLGAGGLSASVVAEDLVREVAFIRKFGFKNS